MIQNRTPLEFVISGGLGNQMFMLCAARYYQEYFDQEVCFDISDLNRIANLHPGLNVYQLGFIKEGEISKKNLNSVRRDFTKLFIRVKDILEFITKVKLSNRHYIVPEVGYFDFTAIPSNTRRIEGYFQSWFYYKNLKTELILKNEIRFTPSAWYLEMHEKLDKNEYAAFHIRRGDYLSPLNRENGVLSIEYFKKVAKLIPKKIAVLIFSDSPREIAPLLKSLGINFELLEPPIGSDPVESWLLMSRASYIAISNSTFSWWAAALSEKDTKVYAPEKWFELRSDPLSLYPEHWIKIPNEWERQP
jgi:hypothetical protein